MDCDKMILHEEKNANSLGLAKTIRAYYIILRLEFTADGHH